jgi:hypothetical protein
MLTNCRFNHVSYLSIEEETIPVRIKTTLFPEEGTPRESTERVISGGIWVHTSEFLVEHTPAKKLELDEEINKRDLSSLLHEARPSTYPPVN